MVLAKIIKDIPISMTAKHLFMNKFTFVLFKQILVEATRKCVCTTVYDVLAIHCFGRI